jgi:hypothetical protein
VAAVEVGEHVDTQVQRHHRERGITCRDDRFEQRSGHHLSQLALDHVDPPLQPGGDLRAELGVGKAAGDPWALAPANPFAFRSVRRRPALAVDDFRRPIMAVLHTDPARNVHLNYPQAGHLSCSASHPCRSRSRNGGEFAGDLQTLTFGSLSLGLVRPRMWCVHRLTRSRTPAPIVRLCRFLSPRAVRRWRGAGG